MARLTIVRQHREAGGPSRQGASKWVIMRGRLMEMLGHILNKAGVPGFIQPISYNDPLTGCRITIAVRPLLTVLSVDGRDYCFDRITGHLAGTGVSCALSPPVYCKPDRTPKSVVSPLGHSSRSQGQANQ